MQTSIQFQISQLHPTLRHNGAELFFFFLFLSVVALNLHRKMQLGECEKARLDVDLWISLMVSVQMNKNVENKMYANASL